MNIKNKVMRRKNISLHNLKASYPRRVGCFLHISSLPSKQGIGCFDEHAKQFIDFLTSAGMSYWQICPMTPTGIGNSPYQGCSAFAGNPYFINLQKFVELGLLQENEISKLNLLSHNRVDFSAIYGIFWEILRLAYERFEKSISNFTNFNTFISNEAFWLNDYATFMSLKSIFHGTEWYKWPQKFNSPKAAKKNLHIFPNVNSKIRFFQFIQWAFFEQWKEIKQYANESGIQIIGDVPIFVGLDSVDVWANRKCFKVTPSGNLTVVAGVPPDAFSATGQLWGNPVFNWKYLKHSKYQWWINRLKHNLKIYDVIRLDHFRGFQSNWEVKANESTAEHGKWVQTAGKYFFTKIKKHLPDAKFIAEDLGVITPETQELLEHTNFPGMSVMHFAFDGQPNNKYLPHCHSKNTILYLGTHDNDTTRGWFQSLSSNEKKIVQNYLRTDCSDVTWDMIKLSYGSVANLLILTLQDILNLGSEARFNTPNTISPNNWSWRITEEQLEQLKKYKTDSYLRFLAEIYGRI